MSPNAPSHLGLAGNHYQDRNTLSTIIKVGPEPSREEKSPSFSQMSEYQDQTFLLPSPRTFTPLRKRDESASQEVETATKLPVVIAASTTPTITPSTSPWLRGLPNSEEGSEVEKEQDPRTMSSHHSKYPHDSGSKKHSSKSKSKAKAKNDDWTDVTEPEERRRIQNRIAQRKFRRTITYSYWTST